MCNQQLLPKTNKPNRYSGYYFDSEILNFQNKIILIPYVIHK